MYPAVRERNEAYWFGCFGFEFKLTTNQRFTYILKLNPVDNAWNEELVIAAEIVDIKRSRSPSKRYFATFLGKVHLAILSHCRFDLAKDVYEFPRFVGQVNHENPHLSPII